MWPPNDSQGCKWDLCLVEDKKQIKGLLVLQWDWQGQASQVPCSTGQYQTNSYLSAISWSLRIYKQTCYKADLFYNSIFPLWLFKQISLDNSHPLVKPLPMFWQCAAMLGGEHFGKNVLVALNKFHWLIHRGLMMLAGFVKNLLCGT